jgi:proline racemase
VLPRIAGGAWICITAALRIDRDDPLAEGFALSDTWGPQVGELG